MQGQHGVGVLVKVLVDSQPALDNVYNQMYLNRPQQILARYHYCRHMGADMMKYASVPAVRYNTKLIGML